jgi:hypothetical protein
MNVLLQGLCIPLSPESLEGGIVYGIQGWWIFGQ